MILLLLVAGWVVGILGAARLQLPTEVWLWLGALPLGLLLLFWRDSRLRLWHVILLFFILGALRLQFALPTAVDQQLAQFNDQGRASLVGIVSADPEVRQSDTRLLVDVTKIQVEGAWRDTHGRALVSAPRDTPVRYGDEVQVEGAPQTPPDAADFSYRDYLARQGVFTQVRYARVYVVTSNRGSAFWATLYAWRDAAKQAIAQLLPEPSAALLTGILLGDDNGIPTALRAAFNDTNTAHIIAISGFNIAVLIAALAFVFRRPTLALEARARGAPSPAVRISAQFAHHFVTVLILAFLVLYTLLVGASASVVRACIMGALVIIALEFGRQSWALNALAIAAFLMTLLNPYVLWDVGFQLSFLATLGLVLYAPRWQNWLEGRLAGRTDAARTRQLMRLARDALIVTAAAFLVTAPLIVLYFHHLSLIGFLTNFLILPVQPAIMVLGGAATLLQMLANALAFIPYVSLLPGALAQVAAWGAYVFLQYTVLVVEATAAVPFGSFEFARVDVPLVILFYAALFGVTYLGLRRTGQLLVSRVWVGVTVLALAVMFVWTTALAAPDPRTRLGFVGAAAGDATFIRTRDDYRILINGTDEPNTLLSYLGSQLPPWDRRLDLVIATHLDDGNLASLNAALERYNVGQVLEPSAPARQGVSYAKWRRLTEERGIVSHVAQSGMTLRAGEATLEVVYAAMNLALRLESKGQTFLLAPTLMEVERKELLASAANLDADVAALPNAVDKELVERVTPETVILFVGRRPEDKPSAETLKMLEGVTVLRTDERGTITAVLEGERLGLVPAK